VIKVAVILLAVAAMILGMLYYREFQHSQSVSAELTAACNQVATAEAETASVKAQMADRVAELESTITGVKKEKAQVEARAGQLEERIKAVEQDLQDEKNRVLTAENQRNKLMIQLASVSNELAKVRVPVVESHETEAELRTCRERAAKLEFEKALVERELNDPEALQARLRVANRRLWEQRVERWKRQDREDWHKGNRGVLFKSGQWQHCW
jgi:chromosome segregation ATPase